MMKIAIVCLWSAPWAAKMTGGLITAMRILASDLSVAGASPTMYAFGKRRSGMRTDFTYLGEAIEPLNEADFVLLSTAGICLKRTERGSLPPLVERLAKELRVPFGVQVHHERETNELAAQRACLLSSPYFRLVAPITERIDRGTEWPLRRVKRVVTLATPDTLRQAPHTRTKRRDVIMTACRYTSTKRLLELARQANKLRIPIEMHGSDAAYFYFKAVKDLEGRYLKVNGAFTVPVSMLLADARWHYNAATQRGEPMARVEIATTEAVEAGCVPILARSDTAEWVTDEHAILIDPKAIRREEIIDARCRSPQPFIEAYNDHNSGKTRRLLAAIRRVSK